MMDDSKIVGTIRHRKYNAWEADAQEVLAVPGVGVNLSFDLLRDCILPAVGRMKQITGCVKINEFSSWEALHYREVIETQWTRRNGLTEFSRLDEDLFTVQTVSVEDYQLTWRFLKTMSNMQGFGPRTRIAFALGQFRQASKAERKLWCRGRMRDWYEARFVWPRRMYADGDRGPYPPPFVRRTKVATRSKPLRVP